MNILTGKAYNDNFPLKLKYAVLRVTNRFKNYGPQGYNNIEGRVAYLGTLGSGRLGLHVIIENQTQPTGNESDGGNEEGTPLF